VQQTWIVKVMEEGLTKKNLKKKKTCGLKPASLLYRPIDRRLSAKLVPTIADSGCRVVTAMDPHGHMERLTVLYFYTKFINEE
jgi:hypothetical protein